MAIRSLIPLIATLIYVSLFLVVIVNHQWQKQHRLFVLFLAAATVWGFSNFLLLSDFLAQDKLLLFRLVIVSSMWWAVQLYYFARSFLDLPAGFGTRFGYASLALLAILAAFGHAPPSIVVEGNTFVGPTYGWWFVLYIVPLIVLASLAGNSLVRRLKTLTDRRERNKLFYLMAAVAMLVIFGFIGISPLSLAEGIPWTHVGSLLAACVLAYAILKHDLVSVNSVLRQGLGWASLSAVGIGAFVLTLYLLHFVFKFELPAIVLITATAVSVVSSIFVYTLRRTLLGAVDQLFYGGTYSYRRTLLTFNVKMGNIINLVELADAMLPTIAKAVRASNVRLLFEDSTTGDFTTRFAYPKVQDKAAQELSFDRDSPIIGWLEKDTGPIDLKQIDFIPQLKGLWQPERDKLASLDLEFLYPIKSRGKLVGILALSTKTSRAPYSQEDLDMIVGMASQGGIMIENARLFDTLTKQQSQIQQMLARSVVAQEEERQRISIDLHDSVAQWLAGASYGVQTADALLPESGNSEVREELATVEQTINKSLKELRRVLIGLRPPALDELGLDRALQRSLEELKSDGLICKFNEDGERVRLSSSIEIAVYRLVQEALTNIRKHARATKVNLNVQFLDGELQVEIRDNGKGFNLSETLDSAVAVGHMGLLGMKQRAEMIGGDIKIRTSEGAGTALVLTVPIIEGGEQSGEEK